MKKNVLALGLVALIAAGAALLFRHTRVDKTNTFHFVDNGSRKKNFDAFPPEIPDEEFDEADFFS